MNLTSLHINERPDIETISQLNPADSYFIQKLMDIKLRMRVIVYIFSVICIYNLILENIFDKILICAVE